MIVFYGLLSSNVLGIEFPTIQDENQIHENNALSTPRGINL